MELIDRRNNCLIISNVENHRSLGLAMDDEGALYVSDFERNEVRRYEREERCGGGIVAGGNGKGAALNQLIGRRQIFVDADHAVYVSESGNHRVAKWTRGAREGVVVAGGQGQGNSLAQLSCPSGIFVDQMDNVYVGDQANHRVMRWGKDAKEGEVIVGGNGEGSQDNQFNQPTSISLNDRGNLYVVDRNNHRVQRFDLRLTDLRE